MPLHHFSKALTLKKNRTSNSFWIPLNWLKRNLCQGQIPMHFFLMCITLPIRRLLQIQPSRKVQGRAKLRYVSVQDSGLRRSSYSICTNTIQNIFLGYYDVLLHSFIVYQFFPDLKQRTYLGFDTKYVPQPKHPPNKYCSSVSRVVQCRNNRAQSRQLSWTFKKCAFLRTTYLANLVILLYL